MSDDKGEVTTPELIQTLEEITLVLATPKYACRNLDKFGGTCMAECKKRNISFLHYEAHVSMCSSCKSYWLAHRLLEQLKGML